ncbi:MULTISPECIES: heptaprenyl diphosphate synthase component 1 [Paenibacillus]|uniref:Heptaprenyl diphosphate synthase component 1 n=1 Tax=Paenibacillus oceani TaxID=2772510 RepID=A0A927C704_9BACL|nr:heptaprenyl diphosphate synthase component 1 [Paenibacillus oceani]MBD2861308.1 heptaprenyl diphosphate synthase component 1 [Paenibacillus oceani]
MNIYSIADATKPYTDYDMIRDHTELPEFPNFRTQLLYTFLRKQSSYADQSELYSIVVSLAQLGLDTHDLVSETNERKEKKEARSRQMKVLAGDYFSSRFYHLLSQAGQVEMTRGIAAAICEVNRLKMNLYSRMRQWKMTTDEYMRFSVDIRMQLYLTFSKALEGLKPNSWHDMLHGYTQCEVLLNELGRIERERDFRCGWAFWHLLQIGTKEERKQLQNGDTDPGKLRSLLHKYNVKATLFQMLETQFKLLSDKIRQFDSEKLVGELYQIGEPFARALTAPRVLEEV